VLAELALSPGVPRAASRAEATRAARAVAALPDPAFLLIIALTYVGVTLWLGRHLWFYYDECDFLARSLGNPMDYLRPHNEHFVALPFLLYGVWRLLVGTESYAPYLLLLAITQIFMAAGLYRLLVSRSRWFAIFAFALLLFLGSGYENQFWAFQIGFVLATAFGAWALVAADRQRTLAAAILLIASAASSNIGLAFIPATAIVIGRRRGLAWLALPLVAFGAWYEAFGRITAPANQMFAPQQLVLVPGYVLASINHALAGITGLGIVAAVALIIALLVGGAIAIARGWRPPALLIAAFVGIVALFAIIGLGRAQLPVLPPRYVTTAAVFVLAAAGSMLPLHIPPSTRRSALAVALVFGFVAFGSNVLAMQAGAHTQLALDQTVYRCEPSR
jgi:hypothetical protein